MLLTLLLLLDPNFLGSNGASTSPPNGGRGVRLRKPSFTVSNLGMFGITEFTSILNAPASCILAVGAIQQVPVVKDGEIAPGNVMKITLTCDHRTVDGAVGSAFLQTLKGLIEDPVRILI